MATTPKDVGRRSAPPLVFWFYDLTRLTTAYITWRDRDRFNELNAYTQI
ncbi:MAG: hypothetical protein ACK400_03360 [Pseudanabaena sp.]